MAKTRMVNLAKELKIDVKDLIQRLKDELGLQEHFTYLSSLDEPVVARVRQVINVASPQVEELRVGENVKRRRRVAPVQVAAPEPPPPVEAAAPLEPPKEVVVKPPKPKEKARIVALPPKEKVPEVAPPPPPPVEEPEPEKDLWLQERSAAEARPDRHSRGHPHRVCGIPRAASCPRLRGLRGAISVPRYGVHAVLCRTGGGAAVPWLHSERPE